MPLRVSRPASSASGAGPARRSLAATVAGVRCGARGQAARQRQQPRAAGPDQPGHGRVVGRVAGLTGRGCPEHGRGQVPVRVRGEHGHHVARARPVQVRRGVPQHLGVDDQGVRPPGHRGALDAAIQQHRERVRVAVDAGRGLHRDQRPAVAYRLLANVGDRARPDGDHAGGPGGGVHGRGERRLVGVHDAVAGPDGDPPDGEAGGQGLLDRHPQVPAAGRDRGRRREHHDLAAGRAQAGRHVGEPGHRARAGHHPAQAERAQPGAVRDAGQLAAEPAEVEPAPAAWPEVEPAPAAWPAEAEPARAAWPEAEPAPAAGPQASAPSTPS